MVSLSSRGVTVNREAAAQVRLTANRQQQLTPAEIQVLLARRTNPPVKLSQEDFDLLARLITAEADGESFLAKVAVGAVVLNRVRSEEFPATVRDVIYQVDNGRYQFEPVLNGWINRPASAEARRAAELACAGCDPTGGALYFFESWVPNQYLRSRPVAMLIDSFTFAY